MRLRSTATAMPEPQEPQEREAHPGESGSLAEQLATIQAELLDYVTARLDRKLRRRMDPEDVVQQILVAVVKRTDEWHRQSTYPFRLWVRLIAAQSLDELRRRHLGAQRRDARREQSLDSAPSGLARGVEAHQTSPSSAAGRNEVKERIQRALERLAPPDREILLLRNEQGLTNEQAASSLGIEKAAASKRYQRAIERLGQLLGFVPPGSTQT